MDKDIGKLFTRLAKSKFRSRFRLQREDRWTAEYRSADELRNHAAGFIEERLAAVCPVNDGKQTPMKGHPVFVAQHATACCCRECLFKWHGIEKGRPLTQEEKAYILGVLIEWIRRDLAKPAPEPKLKKGETPFLL